MDQTIKWFEEHKFIAFIKASSADDAEEMIKAAMKGGFRLFEISMQTPHVCRLLETYAKKDGYCFGAGAVTDGEMAQRAINEGASYVSSLYTDREIIMVAKHNETFVMQGAFTPTEAVNAYQLGADLIKVFPVSLSEGPSYVKFLRGPFPFLKLVAAGGISLESAFDYLKSCVAVSLGKAIFDKSLVRAHNWTEITERAKSVTEKLEGLRVTR